MEQTLQPDPSVTRIAREQSVNANQVFGWRKLYREGLLGASPNASATMLPVAITAPDSKVRNSSRIRRPASEQPQASFQLSQTNNY